MADPRAQNALGHLKVQLVLNLIFCFETGLSKLMEMIFISLKVLLLTIENSWELEFFDRNFRHS